MTEVRLLRWHDLPFAYRLIGRGISFDSQFSLTVGDEGLRHGLLTGIGHSHVYVLRQGEKGGLGLLCFHAGASNARLGYLAPSPQNGGDEYLWLSLLDGLTSRAGQQGIGMIRAEVAEDDPSFEVFRQSGFAVYARQSLWLRPARPCAPASLALRPACQAEASAMVEICRSHIPLWLRQADALPAEADQCFVLDGRDCPRALAVIYRGLRRALVDIYLHPEAYHEADAIVAATLDALGAGTITAVCRLRHDMEWLGNALERTGFEFQSTQVVMIRNTAARVTRHRFKELATKPGTAPLTTPLREIEREM